MDTTLKELYKDYFRMGVACEIINGRFTNHEIGNKDKEALMKKHFNSMTFGNELKPMYNAGFASPEAREDFLPFVLNPNAKAMLEWCRNNDMPVRGHVMVWHSQCPKEIFCKNYTPVTFPTDPELLKENPFLIHFEKLNPVCYVDRDTMLKRLKSYIFNLVEWMYRDGYQEIIYAWDVVNEAIELQDKTETGVRKSYWYDIIGPDYIYWSFRYAKDAVDTMQAKYGGSRPLLFYNDYNEFEPAKKDAIIANLNRKTDEHGSVISEGLIDGIGMQGHLSDNNDIEEYYTALMDYSKLVSVVHITELDVKCTCANKNAEFYQAEFYKAFFEMLIRAKKNGAKPECVTFWGLTDDNSWIRGANPLLFHGDLSIKKSYTALEYALTGESLGEPEVIEVEVNGIRESFENDTNIASIRGMGHIPFLMVTDKESVDGKSRSLAVRRMEKDATVKFDISPFIGQNICIELYVKTKDAKIKVGIDGPKGCELIECDSVAGEFTKITTDASVPAGMRSAEFYVETDGNSEMFIDEIAVNLK